jgi:hypothetical protein
MIRGDLMVDAVTGMNSDFARFILKCCFIPYRVVEENNQKNMLTMDYRDDRINLIIKNNKIEQAYIG